MTNNSDSELSEAPEDSVTPFTIAKAQSIASSGPAPAKHTRFFSQRKGIVLPKASQKRLSQASHPTQEDPAALATIPIYDREMPDALELSDAEEELDYLHTPGPGSSISQSSSSISIKRSRPQTSGVWEHCTRQTKPDGGLSV